MSAVVGVPGLSPGMTGGGAGLLPVVSQGIAREAKEGHDVVSKP
jgi:hypothetical protein